MLDSIEGFESPQDKEEKRKGFLCRYGKNSVLILMPLSLWKEFSIDLNARDVKRKTAIWNSIWALCIFTFFSWFCQFWRQQNCQKNNNSKSLFLVTDQRLKSFVLLCPIFNKFDCTLEIVGISRISSKQPTPKRLFRSDLVSFPMRSSTQPFPNVFSGQDSKR